MTGTQNADFSSQLVGEQAGGECSFVAGRFSPWRVVSRRWFLLPLVMRVAVALAGWAAALAAVLSIADGPGDWGHALCGPWGCGPPLQALIACHLAWLVMIVPPSVALVRSRRVPPHVLRQVGTLLCVAAAAYVATVVIGQRLTWWPTANEWQQDYFWQRCGFVLATTVDVPFFQVLLVGVYLTLRGRTR